MPKEITHGETILWEDPEKEIEQPVVDLRWSNERDGSIVQIVTRVYDAEVPPPDEHDPIPVKYGYHVTLGRHAINKLIRDLRRARDQAFGRDE